ncbi:MAG TPA: ATP-binding protein, partial [Methylocystis sp.]
MLLVETAPSDPLAPLAGESALLLAVSGGPDSVALMLLAARWPRRAAGVKITVATVDHGLRENSREEALQVGRWA